MQMAPYVGILYEKFIMTQTKSVWSIFIPSQSRFPFFLCVFPLPYFHQDIFFLLPLHRNACRGGEAKIDRRSCCYGQPEQLRRSLLLYSFVHKRPPFPSPEKRRFSFPSQISFSPSVCLFRYTHTSKIVDSPHHHHCSLSLSLCL